MTAMDDLIGYLIAETRPGDEVTLTLIRPDGQEEMVEVTLDVRPKSDSVNLLNR